MSRLSVIFLILVLTASCKKDEIKVRTLTGKWNWIRTDGGLAYHIHDTPASTGKNMTLEFKQDDSTYYMHTNGKVTTTGTYRLLAQKCIHDLAIKKVIHFSSGMPDMMIENMSINELSLSDDNPDGVTSQYTKKQSDSRY